MQVESEVASQAQDSLWEVPLPPQRRRRVEKKPRKKPVRWTPAEEQLFLEGLETYGRDWRAISAHLGSRNSESIRSHAQRHLVKLWRDGIPLPDKMKESGDGYTLSGAPLDPDSGTVRAYLGRGKANKDGRKRSDKAARKRRRKAAGRGQMQGVSDKLAIDRKTGLQLEMHKRRVLATADQSSVSAKLEQSSGVQTGVRGIGNGMELRSPNYRRWQPEAVRLAMTGKFVCALSYVDEIGDGAEGLSRLSYRPTFLPIDDAVKHATREQWTQLMDGFLSGRRLQEDGNHKCEAKDTDKKKAVIECDSATEKTLSKVFLGTQWLDALRTPHTNTSTTAAASSMSVVTSDGNNSTDYSKADMCGSEGMAEERKKEKSQKRSAILAEIREGKTDAISQDEISRAMSTLAVAFCMSATASSSSTCIPEAMDVDMVEVKTKALKTETSIGETESEKSSAKNATAEVSTATTADMAVDSTTQETADTKVGTSTQVEDDSSDVRSADWHYYAVRLQMAARMSAGEFGDRHKEYLTADTRKRREMYDAFQGSFHSCRDVCELMPLLIEEHSLVFIHFRLPPVLQRTDAVCIEEENGDDSRKQDLSQTVKQRADDSVKSSDQSVADSICALTEISSKAEAKDTADMCTDSALSDSSMQVKCELPLEQMASDCSDICGVVTAAVNCVESVDKTSVIQLPDLKLESTEDATMGVLSVDNASGVPLPEFQMEDANTMPEITDTSIVAKAIGESADVCMAVATAVADESLPKEEIDAAVDAVIGLDATSAIESQTQQTQAALSKDKKQKEKRSLKNIVTSAIDCMKMEKTTLADCLNADSRWIIWSIQRQINRKMKMTAAQKLAAAATTVATAETGASISKPVDGVSSVEENQKPVAVLGDDDAEAKHTCVAEQMAVSGDVTEADTSTTDESSRCIESITEKPEEKEEMKPETPSRLSLPNLDSGIGTVDLELDAKEPQSENGFAAMQQQLDFDPFSNASATMSWADSMATVPMFDSLVEPIVGSLSICKDINTLMEDPLEESMLFPLPDDSGFKDSLIGAGSVQHSKCEIADSSIGMGMILPMNATKSAVSSKEPVVERETIVISDSQSAEAKAMSASVICTGEKTKANRNALLLESDFEPEFAWLESSASVSKGDDSDYSIGSSIKGQRSIAAATQRVKQRPTVGSSFAESKQAVTGTVNVQVNHCDDIHMVSTAKVDSSTQQLDKDAEMATAQLTVAKTIVVKQTTAATDTTTVAKSTTVVEKTANECVDEGGDKQASALRRRELLLRSELFVSQKEFQRGLTDKHKGDLMSAAVILGEYLNDCIERYHSSKRCTPMVNYELGVLKPMCSRNAFKHELKRVDTEFTRQTDDGRTVVFVKTDFLIETKQLDKSVLSALAQLNSESGVRPAAEGKRESIKYSAYDCGDTNILIDGKRYTHTGITAVNGLLTDDELFDLEFACNEHIVNAYHSQALLPMTGQRTPADCRSVDASRVKFFFGSRYLWRKKEDGYSLSDASHGIRTDVDPMPEFLKAVVLDKLKSVDCDVLKHFAESEWLNQVAYNVYCDSSEGIKPHFDDSFRFAFPITTLRLLSDSRLAFGCVHYGHTNGDFCVALKRGTFCVIHPMSLASDVWKHCVRESDLSAKSAALIFRRVLPTCIAAAKQM